MIRKGMNLQRGNDRDDTTKDMCADLDECFKARIELNTHSEGNLDREFEKASKDTLHSNVSPRSPISSKEIHVR